MLHPGLVYNPTMDLHMDSTLWTNYIEGFPQAHLLQTSAWGKLKSSFGWRARWVEADDAGAQILFRELPLGFTLAYIPKGPIGEWLPELLPVINKVCQEERAFMLKIEPDAVWNSDLADRKGVTVQPWNDILAFTAMTLETAERDQFGAHSHAYFQRAYDLFQPSAECELFVAEIEGEPVAAMMVFARGQRAWYFYGASLSIHREKMPTYLLQWEAMRWAKSRGCTSYDLWGIPDADEKTLEDQFTSRSDGLWGVYRFKRGFGGQILRSMGAWDLPYSPMLNQLYQLALRLRG
jgi:lipid II:glycine glycyltransferase (peptidoglycan interpeptide bridge formation enzyme)